VSEPGSGIPAPRAHLSLLLRVLASGVAIVIWFWTQSLIGARTTSPIGINDGLQNLFAGLNSYFRHAPAAANSLLIVSSALIDALGLFLIAKWILAGVARPFLGLIVLLGLRQVMQTLCALPAPPNAIWHYPGFPSLFVTYGVANDYFFSGHTAIAVFGATELARLKKTCITAIAAVVVIFEIVTVLILRAHYTMDVFTGAIVALWVASFCDSLSVRLDSFRGGAV
jgi:hypothetical protein